MSSSRNTAYNNSKNTTATPYCKVCRDAGKPESEYTSHFVKDQPGPNGKVICPTLLNQACRICNNTGHTSSYCPEYKSRREEPSIRRRGDYYYDRRREERYIPREEETSIRRRGDDYYYDRRREERYIPREEEPRSSSRRIGGGSGGYYNNLREDTERRERDICERNEEYHREQEERRRPKPWLQAVLKTSEQQQQRREPYAHPHGPRVRLNLEENALCASKHAVAETNEKQKKQPALPEFDVCKVQLKHAEHWGDEDLDEDPYCVFRPEDITDEFLENFIFTTSAEHDFIAECDDQSKMPFFCGE